MFPSVMKAVTGREFSAEKARVQNYVRFKVKGESYPGLTPLEGAVTEGVLYRDVDALSVRRLDDFEGELYERTEIPADTLVGESLTAQTYLIKARHRDRLSSEPWDPEHFEKADLIDFMARYWGFNRTDRSDPSDLTDRSDQIGIRPGPLHAHFSFPTRSLQPHLPGW
jgi:gamma-glutamylcyclotransferase (GGCT)/AIG2-like uncharacterized protein YtfP